MTVITLQSEQGCIVKFKTKRLEVRDIIKLITKTSLNYRFINFLMMIIVKELLSFTL